jgi:hypothetical protein
MKNKPCINKNMATKYASNFGYRKINSPSTMSSMPKNVRGKEGEKISLNMVEVF